jgi:hypothetical protein
MTATQQEPLHDLARHARSAGVHPATVTRWITRGVRTPQGRVSLKAVRVGGKWKATDSDFTAFLDMLTAANLPTGDAGQQAPRSPAERRTKAAKADEKLKQAGW